MPSTSPSPVTALQPWISQCRVEKRSEWSSRSVAISLAVHAPPRSCLFAKTRSDAGLLLREQAVELVAALPEGATCPPSPAR